MMKLGRQRTIIRFGHIATLQTAQYSIWSTDSKGKSSDLPPDFTDASWRVMSGALPIWRRQISNLRGDISGGAANLRQLIARPVFSLVPYRTPLRGVYLCSSSTPPGGAVHCMCGYYAARAALRDLFLFSVPLW